MVLKILKKPKAAGARGITCPVCGRGTTDFLRGTYRGGGGGGAPLGHRWACGRATPATVVIIIIIIITMVIIIIGIFFANDLNRLYKSVCCKENTVV